MSKPRVDPTFGISSVDVLILTERHPACRWREAQPGSCRERENLAGDAKEKAQAAPTARPKVPMRRRGADCSVVATKRLIIGPVPWFSEPDAPRGIDLASPPPFLAATGD